MRTLGVINSDKSTWFQLMVWFRLTTSHYLNQYWSRFIMASLGAFSSNYHNIFESLKYKNLIDAIYFGIALLYAIVSCEQSGIPGLQICKSLFATFLIDISCPIILLGDITRRMWNQDGIMWHHNFMNRTILSHASHIHELNLEKLAGKLKSEEHIQVIHQQPHFGCFYTIVYGKSMSTIITGTSWWAWWRLKSPTSRLFTQLVCSGTDPCLALDSLVVPFWRPLDGLRNSLLG